VLKHMYPKADIPVIQLSLNMKAPPEYHVLLGKELSRLREKGVLILGSGNLVHNLKRIRWESDAKPYDWALEFNSWLISKLSVGEYDEILNDFHRTEAGKLSIPTLDHYYPLHYILGASDSADALNIEYEEIQNGSISMLSFSYNSQRA